MAPEYRSALLLLGLAVLGQGARLALGRPGQAPGAITLVGGDAPGSPLAHRDSAAASAPLADGERIDLDRAPARELQRLPGVGADLARRIVEFRQAHGAFGGPDRLDSVPGIGPALLARISAHAAYSRVAPAPAAPEAGAGTIDPNSASVNELAAVTGIGKVRARAIVAYRESHGPFATVEALDSVPGIGPATVAKLRPQLEIR